jgi:hypothetical protein
MGPSQCKKRLTHFGLEVKCREQAAREASPTAFRDDECRVRTDHAPANFCIVKHMATNLLSSHVRHDPWLNCRRLPPNSDETIARHANIEGLKGCALLFEVGRARAPIR